MGSTVFGEQAIPQPVANKDYMNFKWNPPEIHLVHFSEIHNEIRSEIRKRKTTCRELCPLWLNNYRKPDFQYAASDW